MASKRKRHTEKFLKAMLDMEDPSFVGKTGFHDNSETFSPELDANKASCFQLNSSPDAVMKSPSAISEGDTSDNSVKRTKLDDNSIGFVDVQKIEYATRTVQKNLKLIINQAPDIQQVNHLLENNSSTYSNSEMQQNSLILLASQIKSKVKLGKGKILEDIVDGNIQISNQDLQQLSKLTSVDPPKELKLQLLPSYVNQHENTPSGLPPLPHITDRNLYERVFIHKSALNNKYYLDQDELLNAHNERLEWLGDSILNNLVTLMIYDRYPNATEGHLTKMRSHLIDNKTLAKFSHAYGFNAKLKTNIEQSILDGGDQKIFADVFEAYVGALGMESGMNFEVIKRWLHELYSPKFDEFDNDINLQPINKEAKSELYSLIGSAQLHPVYELVAKGDGVNKNFIIECRINGDVLGRGAAPNQKDAGLRAAMEALGNKSMLEKYYRIRLESDRNETVISLKQPEPKTRRNKSPIDLTKFPIQVETSSDLLQNDAKNEVYAILGRRIGAVPEYAVTETGDGQFKVDLKVKGLVVATATHSSKKKAMTKAAMAILSNKEILEEIFKL